MKQHSLTREQKFNYQVKCMANAPDLLMLIFTLSFARPAGRELMQWTNSKELKKYSKSQQNQKKMKIAFPSTLMFELQPPHWVSWAAYRP